MITDEEIVQHQLYFEDCAKEYGILAKKLINRFIVLFNIDPHEGFPLKTLNPIRKKQYKQGGEMDNWNYCFHGFHCAFTHKETEQHIEVPLTFGEEYGELDPYFFIEFIKTSPKFQPLPLAINNNYSDGKRILEVMERIGKFEIIESNIKGRKGFIVKERIKDEIKIFKSGLNEVRGISKETTLWQRIKSIINW